MDRWAMRRRRRRWLHALGAPVRFIDWLLWPDPLTLGLMWICALLLVAILVLVVSREDIFGG